MAARPGQPSCSQAAHAECAICEGTCQVGEERRLSELTRVRPAGILLMFAEVMDRAKTQGTQSTPNLSHCWGGPSRLLRLYGFMRNRFLSLGRRARPPHAGDFG